MGRLAVFWGFVGVYTGLLAGSLLQAVFACIIAPVFKNFEV